MVPILQKHVGYVEVHETGMQVLTYACCWRNDCIKQLAFVRVGGIQAILAAMEKHPNKRDVIYHALRALYILTSLDTNAELFVMKTNGVSLGVEGMKQFSDDDKIVHEACDLLHILCKHEHLRSKLDNESVGTSLMMAFESNKENRKIRKIAKDSMTMLLE